MFYPMPELSIVIVNYNTRSKLKACLQSILDERGVMDVEIIVVDNGSQDGSIAMLQAFAPAVRLIQPGHNTWFSGGNNIGVRAATSNYILLLNPDTIVPPFMLQTMLRYLIQQRDVGAVTCRQQHPDGTRLNTCSRLPAYLDLLLDDTLLGVLFPQWRNKRRRWRWYMDWHRDSTQAVEVAPGSCIMARSDLLLSFQIFDDRLKLYFTDDDLCKSILDCGYQIHFLADVTLLHYEKSGIQGMKRTARQIYFADMLTYCRKQYGLWRTLFLQLFLAPTQWAMDFKYYLFQKPHIGAGVR